MKKTLTIFLVLLLSISMTGCGKKKDNLNSNSQPGGQETVLPDGDDKDATIEDRVENNTNDNQEELVFSNIKISEFGATNIVSGTVKNNRNVVRNVRLTLKMYSSYTSRLLGRVSTDITNLNPNEERNFEISIMGDYTTVDKFEVEAQDI